jgi:hypothetical protein
MRVRLAAQMQALAMAIANADPHTFQTSATLVSHPEAKKLGAEDHHAISALSVLHKIGKLTRFRTAFGKTRYGYELPPEEKAAAILRQRRNQAQQPAAPQEETRVPADVKVTVSKGTGALLVEYKGLRLEISIKE